MIPSWREKKVRIELSDVLGGSERGIWVRIKKTGGLAWLPRSRTEIFTGGAFVPEWLAKKILGGAVGKPVQNLPPAA